MAAWCLCSRYLRMFPLWKSSRATDLSLPPAATTRELKSSLVSLPARWTRTLQSTVARPLLTRHTEPSDNPQSTLARSDLTVVRHKSNLKISDYLPTSLTLTPTNIILYLSLDWDKLSQVRSHEPGNPRSCEEAREVISPNKTDIYTTF